MVIARRRMLRLLVAGCSSAVASGWTSGCGTSPSEAPAGGPDAAPLDAGAQADGGSTQDAASGRDQGMEARADAATLPASVVDADGGRHDCAVDLCLDLNDPANSNMLSEGGSVVIRTAPNGDGIVVGRDQGALFAVSAICTHLGCYVAFSATNRDLLCPCHASLFAKTGEVLRGPARRPLRSYAVTMSADARYVLVTLVP